MFEQRLKDAFLGSLAADALAMPAHWYYDRESMDRDYGKLDEYLAPRNPHPDSLLVRSSYQALNEKGEILHRHARYWGMPGIHYHQELEAGENTLSFRLARELYRQVIEHGEYDEDRWLETYIRLMRDPDWNKDTYVEEIHRAFFTNYARGKAPRDCGIDDHHIGGLAQVPALVAALAHIGDDGLDRMRALVQRHIELTHKNQAMIDAGDLLVRLLHRLASGDDFAAAFEQEVGKQFSIDKLDDLARAADRKVIGEMISPACYIGESLPAGLYLSWKYRERFSDGIIANARVGGDNCHRGAVVGSLLAACNGVPDKWLTEKIAND
jgi:ADP-ribosyl-[dinitrogen reductase] hydrolase